MQLSLLLVRPRRQAEAFAAALEAGLPGRFRPLVVPLVAIVQLPATLDLTGVGALAFTSANGVESFAARSDERRLPAYCVGAATAAAAAAAGLAATEAAGDAAALADRIARRHPPRAGAVLHLHGAQRAADLGALLAGSGIAVRSVALYDQRAVEPPARVPRPLADGTVDVVTAFSPRSARLLTEAARRRGWDFSGAAAVSISPAADAALQLSPARRVVAERPGREGMIAALARL